MGRVFKLGQGLWTKSNTGVWSFVEDTCYHGESVIINSNDCFNGVVKMIRIRLSLGVLTPVALTYQLIYWMLLPDGPITPPINLLTDKDLEMTTSMRDYMIEPVVYVTCGPEQVAKYQFACRSPFTVGDKTYLQEGVTEEQHREAIKGKQGFEIIFYIKLPKRCFSVNHLLLFIYLPDLVGGHPLVCSKHMLEIMFNEPHLLIVFRVALEIQMVYANTRDDDPEADVDFPCLTADDVFDMQVGYPLSPDNPANYDENDQGISYHLISSIPFDDNNLVLLYLLVFTCCNIWMIEQIEIFVWLA